MLCFNVSIFNMSLVKSERQMIEGELQFEIVLERSDVPSD